MDMIGAVKVGAERGFSSISVIVRLAIIFSIFYSVYLHLWHLLSASVYLLILLLAPTFIKRQYKIQIPREFEATVLAFVILSLFLGVSRSIFIKLFFGLLVGFIGFATMILIYSRSNIKKDYLIIALFSISFSIAFGTALEIAKYILKGILGYSISVGDYHHAITSLLAIILGSAISLLIGYIYMKDKRFPVMHRVVTKFKKENPNFFIKKVDTPESLEELIKSEESEKLEFKSTLKTNLHTKKDDKKIEHSALKTISAFMNSEGGILLIGVKDNKEIIGIEEDNFQNSDKLTLHLTNLIKEKIGKNYIHLINLKLIKLNNKTVLRIECKRSDKPVFLKWEGKEEFFVRIGPATNQIHGNELIDYIKNNF